MTVPAVFDRIRRRVVAYCPRCHVADDPTTRRLEASLADGAGSVWLLRECPVHGPIVTLYEEDAELLDYLARRFVESGLNDTITSRLSAMQEAQEAIA